jgi:hypothetical protein
LPGRIIQTKCTTAYSFPLIIIILNSATIKQYANNNPVNPQILEILIQTKYSLNSATIKQYPNNHPANPQILEILIQTEKEGTYSTVPPNL